MVAMAKRPEKPRPSKEEIVARAADGSLLDAIFAEWGRHWFADDDPFLADLASAHNSGDVDLLALITPEAIEPYKGTPGFFTGQNLYRALITRLHAPAEALLHAVDTLLKAAGCDLAAGLPVEEFSKWCAADGGRPAELLDLVDRNVPEADRYLTIALKHGVAVDREYFTDRAYGFVEQGTELQRQAAINALGQIPFPVDADYERFTAATETLLATGADDATRATLVTALGRRLKDAPADRIGSLIRLFRSALSGGGERVHLETSRVLAFDFDHLPTELFDPILAALLDINPEHSATIQSIDFGLQKLIENGEVDRARRFLEELFSRHEAIGFEQFDSLRHKLLTTGGVLLQDWVVAWLRTGDFDLCSDVDEHLFGAGADEMTFDIDFTRFDLADAEYSFLARKAIGSFFLKPRIMASILVSLLRSAPAEAAHDIEELLVDPILINYSGVARDYLEPIGNDAADPAAIAVRRALKALGEYIEGLKSIGTVPELHPSEHERQLEWQRHSDQMAEAWRKARKKSIFALVVTESLMLYGNRSINWVTDPTEEPRRIETPLASISHSFEIPRIDTVDPLGLQLMLLSFRQERPAV